VSKLLKKVKRSVKKIVHSWKNTPGKQKGIAALVFVLLFAGIGSYFLVFSRAASITYAIPTTIAADCSRDVTAEINNWITSVPNGAAGGPNTLMFGAGKCYRVDGSLGSTFGAWTPAGYKRQHLVFEGNGSSIDGSHYMPAERTNRAGLSFELGVGITVQNFTIKGNHTYACNAPLPTDKCKIAANGSAGYDANREWQHGIAFFGVDTPKAINNKIYNVFGDGITFGQAPSPTTAGANVANKNGLAQGNFIDGTGRMGLAITAGVNIAVRNNTFDRVSYHIIDLENEAHLPIHYITIDGNIIKRHWLSFVAGSSGECVEDSQHDITITNNVMEAPGMTENPPVYFEAYTLNTCPFSNFWRDYNISGNRFKHIAQRWLTLKKVKNSVVANNTAEFVYGSYFQGGSDFVSGDPDIHLHGLADPAGIRIENNTMLRSPAVYSIYDSLSPSGTFVVNKPWPGLNACGNATNSGTNQLVACSATPPPADTTPPTTSITSHPNGATVAGVANLTATATDNTAVTKVEFYVDGALKGSDADNTAPYTYAWDTKTTTNGSHTLMSKAYDTAGNIGTSPTVTVTVNNPTADTQPPTAPANLTATSISSTQINLAWTASTDNVGVTGYDIYRNGAKIATVTTTSYGNTGLAASTSYSYHVIARDATTNSSPQSNTATATTKAPPPPPSATSTLSGTVRSNTGSLLAGAKVSLTVNGSKRTLVTNSVGQYAVTGLPAGTYQVKYSAQQHVAQALGVSLASGSINTKDVILVKR
jgi:chitodextrinase